MTAEKIPIPWKLPTKIKGDSMIYPQSVRDRLVNQVINAQSREETKKWGRTVTAETIIFNCVVHPSTYTRLISAQMRDRYQQLEKEDRHGKKKYINQFKSEG